MTTWIRTIVSIENIVCYAYFKSFQHCFIYLLYYKSLFWIRRIEMLLLIWIYVSLHYSY